MKPCYIYLLGRYTYVCSHLLSHARLVLKLAIKYIQQNLYPKLVVNRYYSEKYVIELRLLKDMDIEVLRVPGFNGLVQMEFLSRIKTWTCKRKNHFNITLGWNNQTISTKELNSRNTSQCFSCPTFPCCIKRVM